MQNGSACEICSKGGSSLQDRCLTNCGSWCWVRQDIAELARMISALGGLNAHAEQVLWLHSFLCWINLSYVTRICSLFFGSSVYTYEIVALCVQWGAERTIQIRKYCVWYRLDSVCLNMTWRLTVVRMNDFPLNALPLFCILNKTVDFVGKNVLLCT